MDNPFASLDLQFLRTENKSNRNTAVEIRQQLKDVDSSNIKGARDSLVLLLRFHYLLRPNEIASLNICDIDMESGILHVVNRKRNQYLVLCEQDVFYFKRWLAMRKLFSKSSPAFIISLHWTYGRSLPHQRISVRGIFQIVEKYRVDK